MTWKLPTKADWQNMIIGCGGSIDATSGQMDFTDLQEKLYAVTDHALTLQNYYWTADEYDEYNVYNLRFDCMSMTANFSYCMPTNYISFYTHACIDFNVAEPVSIVATTADVGKLLCTDGSIYPSVSEAVAAGKTVAAMIAYVDKQSKKGLALALADEVEVDNGVSSNTVWWDNAVGAANTHTPIIGGATWRLPTIDDWQNMLVGCGDVTNDGYDYTYDKINDKLSSAGAPLQQGYYWSSTIIDNDALLAHFENDVATLYSLINPHDNHQYYARACLDFDVADALEPDFAVTTSDLGKVVCTDGSIYDSVAAAEADSKTPVGMIAFVDMEQETGLVIALNDDCHIINEGTVYEQTDYMMDKATATTVAGAHTPAINDNLWRLPTIEEWKQMLLGTDPDGTGVNDFTFSSDYLNNNLAAVGGFQLEGYYCHPH